MGYETWHNFAVIRSADETQTAAVRTAVADYFELERDEIDGGFSSRRYECDIEEDLSKIAKANPDVLFEISGDGEESDDIWEKRFFGDEMETVRFEGLPPFRRLV